MQPKNHSPRRSARRLALLGVTLVAVAGAPAPAQAAAPFAVVGLDGSFVRGHNVDATVRRSRGKYSVRFHKAITACAYLATPALAASGDGSDAGEPLPAALTTGVRPGTDNEVLVRAYDGYGRPTNVPFQLQVQCQARSPWAVVDAGGVTTRGGGGGTSVAIGGFPGSLEVGFRRPVDLCAYTSTIGDAGTSAAAPGLVVTAQRSGNPKAAFVETHGISGVTEVRPFHVNIACGTRGIWGVYDAAGFLSRGSLVMTGVARRAPGLYEVRVAQDVSQCSYVATVGTTAAGLAVPRFIAAGAEAGTPSAIIVAVQDMFGGGTDASFHLNVIC